MEKQFGKHCIKWKMIHGIKRHYRVKRIKVRCTAETNITRI